MKKTLAFLLVVAMVLSISVISAFANTTVYITDKIDTTSKAWDADDGSSNFLYASAATNKLTTKDTYGEVSAIFSMNFQSFADGFKYGASFQVDFPGGSAAYSFEDEKFTLLDADGVIIGEKEYTFNMSETYWYDFAIQKAGNTVKVYINNDLIITGSANSFEENKEGKISFSNSNINLYLQSIYFLKDGTWDMNKRYDINNDKEKNDFNSVAFKYYNFGDTKDIQKKYLGNPKSDLLRAYLSEFDKDFDFEGYTIVNSGYLNYTERDMSTYILSKGEAEGGTRLNDTYDLNSYTIRMDVLFKSMYINQGGGYEEKPSFLFMVGPEALKLENGFTIGYDFKQEAFFAKKISDGQEKNVKDAVVALEDENKDKEKLTFNEWHTVALKLFMGSDEIGEIMQAQLFVDGIRRVDFQDDTLFADLVEPTIPTGSTTATPTMDNGKVKEPVPSDHGQFLFRKYNLQMAIDNVIFANGEASLNDSAFKIGCKANGHILDEGTMVKESVNGEDGAYIFKCTECNYEQTVIYHGEPPTKPDVVVPSDPSYDDNNPTGTTSIGGTTSSPSVPNKNNPDTSASDLFAAAGIASVLAVAAIICKKKEK